MREQEENDKAPKVEYEGGLPLLRQPSEAERKQDEADRRAREQIGLNRSLVIATVALVICTVALGGVQACYLHRQWKLASDGLSKMGDQIWAAKDAAFAAKEAVDTASKALATNEQQFRLDERPYLAPQPRGIFQDPKTGNYLLLLPSVSVDNFGACVDFVNRGKSPAIEVVMTHTEYKIGPIAKVRNEVDNYVPHYSSPPNVVVSNGDLTAGCSATTISQNDLREWANAKNATVEVYVVGSVIYRDMFKPALSKPYETRYCWRIEPTGLPWNGCLGRKFLTTIH